MNRRVIIAGGSGFIGSLLQERLVVDNYDVVVLTRSPRADEGSIRQALWDGRTLGDWTRELDGARALINVAGRSVNCHYNAHNRREILESRVDSTRAYWAKPSPAPGSRRLSGSRGPWTRRGQERRPGKEHDPGNNARQLLTLGR